MAEATEGHESTTSQDAFGLTAEDFQAQMAGARSGMSGETAGDTTEGTPAKKDQAPAKDDAQEKTSDEKAPEGEKPDKTAAPEMFLLEDETAPPADDTPAADDSKPGDKQPEMVEIVHKGQAIKVTQDKLIELAQKGYDYDVKVGPHHRLIRMINADPELQQLITTHVKAKLGKDQQPAAKGASSEEFTPPKLEDYNTPEDWAKATYEAMQNHLTRAVKPPAQDPQQENQQKVDAPTANIMRTMFFSLQHHDPDNMNRVLPEVQKVWPTLRQVDADRISRAALEGDTRPFLKLYDWVAAKLNGKPAGSNKNGNGKTDTKPPGFRVSPGGGAPKNDAGKNDVWAMSKKEFKEFMEKAKAGYA